MNLSCSGLMLTGCLLDGVRERVGRRAVDRGNELDGQGAVVADVLERAHDGAPVERAHAAGQAVVVGDVEVDQPAARLADGRQHVGLFDVEVEGVETHAAIRTDRLGQRQCLLRG